jgi:hypothetical protein
MAHSVDLEGVADDGYGYTVKITAPGRTQQTISNRMWHVPKFNFRGRKGEQTRESETREGLTIPVVTELNVAESWKAPEEKS